MGPAVSVVLVVVPLAFFVAMCVVLVPGLRKLRRVSREARAKAQWPAMARSLTAGERFRLARKIMRAEPGIDPREANLLVSRARFQLELRDHLAEQGAGSEWFARLLSWVCAYFALQAACMLVRWLAASTSRGLGLATIVLAVVALYLFVIRLLFPALQERESRRLRQTIDRNQPRSKGAT